MTNSFRRAVPALLLTLTLLLAQFTLAAPLREANPPGLADGAGIWVNIWHYPDGNLDAYCEKLKANGVRNLFIQTSRSTTTAIPHPEKLAAIIDACHKHNIRVIAWSFATLIDPIADAEKMIAAANFRTPSGECLDAVAPNLEQNLEQWRVEKYSAHIRERLGSKYPLIAVVYSPLNRAPEVARIPWKTLAKHYDVIAPMSYWNSKYQKLDPYQYTVETCKKVRELTGRPDLEIHVIGDGMGTRMPAIAEFMRGCQTAEAASSSLYPNHLVTEEQYAALARYRDYHKPNSRFRLAAFREMLNAGVVNAPDRADPSQPVSRGEFYRMVLKHLKPGLAPHLKAGGVTHVPKEPTAVEASNILTQAGLIWDSSGLIPEVHLSQPLYPEEAYGLLAQIVDVHQVKGKAAGNPKAKRWFSQPAAAATSAQPAGSPQQRPINFLDASQIVLEAGSAIR